jgi:hypothetical protein
MKTETSASFFGIVLAMYASNIYKWSRESVDFKDLSNESSFDFIENVWSNDTLDLLQEMMRSNPIKDLASDDIPSSKYDNIGEATDILKDGSCPDKYTINKNEDKW